MDADDMDDDDYDEEGILASLLDVAVRAAILAGDIISTNTADKTTNSATKTKANSRDLLTLVDPMCEEVIRRTILDSFPDHDFLGE